MIVETFVRDHCACNGCGECDGCNIMDVMISLLMNCNKYPQRGEWILVISNFVECDYRNVMGNYYYGIFAVVITVMIAMNDFVIDMMN